MLASFLIVVTVPALCASSEAVDADGSKSTRAASLTAAQGPYADHRPSPSRDYQREHEPYPQREIYDRHSDGRHQYAYGGDRDAYTGPGYSHDQEQYNDREQQYSDQEHYKHSEQYSKGQYPGQSKRVAQICLQETTANVDFATGIKA
jgi:hypothetical protein